MHAGQKRGQRTQQVWPPLRHMHFHEINGTQHFRVSITKYLQQVCPKCGPREEFLRPLSGLKTYLLQVILLMMKILDRYFPDLLNFCSATNPKLAGLQTSSPYIQASF